MNDQIVLNAQRRLSHHFERMAGEQIKILMNAAGKSVFNRNHRAIGFPESDRTEDLFEGGAGEWLDAHSENFGSGMLTEGTKRTLEGDSGAGGDRQGFILFHVQT